MLATEVMFLMIVLHCFPTDDAPSQTSRIFPLKAITCWLGFLLGAASSLALETANLNNAIPILVATAMSAVPV